VFQHFHAGDDIEISRLLSGEVFGADFAVIHILGLRFHSVQLRHFERFGSQINTQYARPAPSHRIRQNTAATAHIQHPFSLEASERVDPI
jgi:hypothetical protein